jgi:N-acetylneuraminic acid mutarotase
VIGGKIHVFGGRLNETVENLGSHHIYDPMNDSWSEAAPVPTPRSAGAFAAIGNLLFFAGGECTPDGQNFDQVEAYDLNSGSWVDYGNMPRGLHGFVGAALGNELHFIGGSDPCGGGTKLDEHFVLTVP